MSGKLQEARTYATQLQKASRQNNRVAQQMERRNAALNAALKIKKVFQGVSLLVRTCEPDDQKFDSRKASSKDLELLTRQPWLLDQRQE